MSSNIPAKGTIFTDPSVKAACTMFKKVAYDEGLEKLAVIEFEDRLSLGTMIESEGWLAHFMMRSDEISIRQNGRRMWDAAYMVDQKCFALIRPVSMDYAEKQSLDLTHYTSHESPDEMIDPRLRYMINKLALYDSINISQDNVVSLKPLNESLYTNYTDKPLENGDLMPFLSKEHMKLNSLMAFSEKLKHAYEKTMERHQNASPTINQ